MNRPGREQPLLAMRGIVKTFPGVRALRGVDLDLGRGEILAVLGENGAGKSTLMKVLGGDLRADAGTIEMDGRVVSLRSPFQARAAGIAVINQEVALVPGLNAVDNIFLDRRGSWLGLVRRSEERRRAAELLHRLGGQVPLDVPCGRLTAAQRQFVEIARALAGEPRIVVMDEPTTALTTVETQQLFTLVRDLRSRGVGVIWISHRLEEIFDLADRAVVLRDGRGVADRPLADLDRGKLIALMVGRDLAEEYPPRKHAVGGARLVVSGLCLNQQIRDVSFEVRAGEILGLAGLVGAGRTETVRLLFGAERATAGRVVLDGRPLKIRSPREAIAAGIGLLTEDRRLQGLVLGRSVRENFALPNLSRFSRWGLLLTRRERHACRGQIDALGVRPPSMETPAGLLSGGNQQKVVLSKWLERDCEVVLFDEPTRGIDVGARHEIYQLINALAERGKAVVLVSSDLPELLGMADRILVMRAGRLVGERTNGPTTTQEEIMALAFG